MGNDRRAARLLGDVASDLRFAWKNLVFADAGYKVLAFAVLSPALALVVRWLITRRQGPVVADVEILRFFVTTRSGLLVLVLGGAIVSAIAALEVACLSAIGIAAAERRQLLPRHALAFAGARAAKVLALTAHMVVRVIASVIPFGIAAGLVWFGLLHSHDINFYIAQKPPSFWGAAAIVVALVVAGTAWLLRTVARWALSLPIVLFEDVPPRRALREAGNRSLGHRGLILGVLAAWGAVALALVAFATWLPEAIGRTLAPQFAGSLAALIPFILALVVLWTALGLAAGIFNVSVFSLVITRLYRHTIGAREPRIPAAAGSAGVAVVPHRYRPHLLAAVAAITLAGSTGTALLAIAASERSQSVVVIAHRGSSWTTPENTLSAFRLAADQRTDYVELDVQESSDGEVIVVHDSDLMRVGNWPFKIWEATGAELRGVPIPWRKDPSHAPERLPTLAESLEACRGRCKVIVELKSYGHDERLEERVAAVVEAAGMENDCVYMSLDHDMVRRMKQLRPAWRSGVLVAKAMGDLSSFPADFYAVEAKLATRRFVRKAHAEGREVYVWTVNDPAWMLAAMSRGVDGLITDRPDVAREVVERRAKMSDAERVLVALLVRLGVRDENLEVQ